MDAFHRIAGITCALLLVACNSQENQPVVVASAPAPAAPVAPANPVQANPLLAQNAQQVADNASPAPATPAASAVVPANQNDPFKAFLDNQKKK
jgi:hypothetical protein